MAPAAKRPQETKGSNGRNNRGQKPVTYLSVSATVVDASYITLPPPFSQWRRILSCAEKAAAAVRREDKHTGIAKDGGRISEKFGSIRWGLNSAS